jgi:cyanophycin synthetase
MAEAAGISVPEYVTVGIDNIDEAQDLLVRTGGPCVVKPVRDTASGLGITTYVQGPYALEWAVARASIFCPEILVESQVPGESYRLLFLNGDLIHAVRRRGTRVQADGIHTVRELAVRSRVGPFDEFGVRTLEAQGWTADAVPPNGTSVLLRGLPTGQTRTRELRTVYDEDVTSLIGPDLVDELSGLVLRLRVSFAGIDVITVDPTRPLGAGGGALIEVNTTPGIHHHDVRRDGNAPFRVGEAVLSELLSVAGHGTTSRAALDSPEIVD